MSNVVDKQPHIHGASLMHSQAHLASMAPAPSNRPTSGEGLNGLLNADGAIPHTMQAGPVSGGGSHGAAPGLGMRDEDAGGFGNMPLANGTRNGYGYGGNLSQ